MVSKKKKNNKGAKPAKSTAKRSGAMDSSIQNPNRVLKILQEIQETETEFQSRSNILLIKLKQVKEQRQFKVFSNNSYSSQELSELINVYQSLVNHSEIIKRILFDHYSELQIQLPAETVVAKKNEMLQVRLKQLMLELKTVLPSYSDAVMEVTKVFNKTVVGNNKHLDFNKEAKIKTDLRSMDFFMAAPQRLPRMILLMKELLKQSAKLEPEALPIDSWQKLTTDLVTLLDISIKEGTAEFKNSPPAIKAPHSAAVVTPSAPVKKQAEKEEVNSLEKQLAKKIAEQAKAKVEDKALAKKESEKQLRTQVPDKKDKIFESKIKNKQLRRKSVQAPKANNKRRRRVESKKAAAKSNRRQRALSPRLSDDNALSQSQQKTRNISRTTLAKNLQKNSENYVAATQRRQSAISNPLRPPPEVPPRKPAALQGKSMLNSVEARQSQVDSLSQTTLQQSRPLPPIPLKPAATNRSSRPLPPIPVNTEAKQNAKQRKSWLEAPGRLNQQGSNKETKAPKQHSFADIVKRKPESINATKTDKTLSGNKQYSKLSPRPPRHPKKPKSQL